MGKRESIKIFLRIRPDRKNSRNAKSFDLEHSFDSSLVKFHVDRKQESDFQVNSSVEDFQFKFDRVFDTTTTQAQVFDTVAADCVKSVIGGYNSTIFAYGQTGSGKTYSITGGTASYNERGIIPRCLSMIYEETAKLKQEFQWTIRISYLQIYNEKGQDLLNRGQDAAKLEDLPTVTIQESDDEVVLKGLESQQANTTAEALDLLFQGDSNRIYCATTMNEASSRSHCVFTVMLEARRHGTAVVRRSKLNLVDLAGSERVSKTGVTGQLLNEAKHINLSLHYLEHVIVSLAERKDHIPYRNSTITKVLRDSLGGNCKTAMLATGDPSEEFLWETVSTCRFAMRVGSIKLDAHVNEEHDPIVLVKQLRKEVAQLKDQLLLQGNEGNDPTRKLSSDELGHCRALVNRFIEDQDPNATINGLGGDMARVNACFALLKESIGTTKSSVGTRQDAGPPSRDSNHALHEQIRQLQASVQLKENEITLLYNVVKNTSQPKVTVATQTGAQAEQALACGPLDKPLNHSVVGLLRHTRSPNLEMRPPSDQEVALTLANEKLKENYNLAALTDVGLTQNRATAFEAFRKSYRKFEQLQKTQEELQTLMNHVKIHAEEINSLVSQIKTAKMKVQRYRADRALQGDKEPDPSSEESRLVSQIETELKPTYQSRLKELQQGKEKIEVMSHMLKQTSERLTEDFRTWFDARQSQVMAAQSTKPPTTAPSLHSSQPHLPQMPHSAPNVDRPGRSASTNPDVANELQRLQRDRELKKAKLTGNHVE